MNKKSKPQMTSAQNSRLTARPGVLRDVVAGILARYTKDILD